MGFDDPNEKLFRAVRPAPMFWKSNGTLSSAAFIDRRGGLSVDRAKNRPPSEAVAFMKNQGFEGTVVSVTVANCTSAEVHAHLVEAPSKARNDPFHCEIHGSTEHFRLQKSQASALASCANIEGEL